MFTKIIKYKNKLVLNRKMKESMLKAGSSYATISRVGGFITRLKLRGYDLLHLDPQEYAKAEPGKAHYGAPFLCPPGINPGYDRHGPWRNMLWSISDKRSTGLDLQLKHEGIFINQTICLQENIMGMNVVVENKSRKAVPVALGLHYYWHLNAAQVDFGKQLIGHPAWDNIKGKNISRVSKAMLAKAADGIDLHIKTGNSRLSIYDKDRGISIGLDGYNPSFGNTTWVLYRKKDSPFYAIEMWSAPQGTLGNAGSLRIAGGEKTFFKFFVSVAKGNIFSS